MRNIKVKTHNAQDTHLWIVGGGIAGMAAAAFAIRDAKVPAQNIHILEELDISGGAMDGGHSPSAEHAWVTRGGRMLTDETYLKLAAAVLMNSLMKVSSRPISGGCGVQLLLFNSGIVQSNCAATS